MRPAVLAALIVGTIVGDCLVPIGFAQTKYEKPS
jgi:hypothetical protein